MFGANWSRRDFVGSSIAAGSAWLAGVRSAVGGESPTGDTAENNLFLSGNFAPVREEVTADDLPVVGRIPSGLEGMFVRNGPNPQFPPLGHYHWFDGDGMLHGVRLAGGKASYRNRYIRTAGFEAERAAGKALWKGMANAVDLTKLIEGKSTFKNAANTALVWHDGRLLALWEGGEPHEVRVPELTTVGPYTWNGALKHSCTAHPKVDPVTGEMMFFGYGFGRVSLVYSVADAAGKIIRTEPIDLPRPVMMHDFAVTKNYSIFLDLPATYNMVGLAKREGLLRYDPDLGARFGILPRHGTGKEIRWFTVDPCFVFHTLNAHEEGDGDDEVVVLGCRMDRYPDLVMFGPPKRNPTWDDFLDCPPRLYRWRFNLKTGATSEEAVDDQAVDFPRVPDRVAGRPSRHGYCMGMRMDGLVKYDLATGQSTRHSHGDGRFGGEGVFVSRPEPKSEDDGWVLSYVQDEASGKSELIVIDAMDFTAPPLARVWLPVRVPYGFHGCWIGEDQFRGGA